MNNINNKSSSSLTDIAEAIARDEPYEVVVHKVCDIISTDPKVDEATLLTITRLVVDAMTAQFAFDSDV
jgi:hypothetical protein